MTVQEEIIKIISEPISKGIKKALQILYYLVLQKRAGGQMVTKDLQKQLSIPQKSLYNSLADLESEGLILWMHRHLGKREKQIQITSKGEHFLYRKILPLFVHHEDNIHILLDNEEYSGGSDQSTLLEEFLNFIISQVRNFFTIKDPPPITKGGFSFQGILKPYGEAEVNV